MRKIDLCIAVLLSPIGLIAQENKYVLTGKIPAFKQSEKIFLLKGNQADSTALGADGSFLFEGTAETPLKSYLLVGTTLREGYKKPFPFYLEEGKIDITSKDSLQNAEIKGGEANEHQDELKASLKKVDDEQTALYDWYRSLSQDQQESEETKNKIDNVNKGLADERKEIYTQFLEKHNDSPIALDVLKSYAGYSPEYGDVYPRFQKLSDKVQKSAAGVKYLEELQKYEALAIGKVAPEFSQTDTAGNIIHLKDFRGKYVLIDFWASWCGPCRAENPNVVKAFNAFKDQGFTVLGVSLDDEKGRDAWLKAIEVDGLQQWTQLSDLKGWKNEASTLYGVRAIPTNYLLDTQGNIIAKNLRGEYLEKKLQEIFSKK